MIFIYLCIFLYICYWHYTLHTAPALLYTKLIHCIKILISHLLFTEITNNRNG